MRRIPTSSGLGWRAVGGALLAGALLGACAWVKLTDAGQGVHVVTASQVTDCEKIGATHAKTSATAGIFARNPRKIDQEVEYLARNEAADMGGNAIVARSATSDEGRRSYDVFLCH